MFLTNTVSWSIYLEYGGSTYLRRNGRFNRLGGKFSVVSVFKWRDDQMLMMRLASIEDIPLQRSQCKLANVLSRLLSHRSSSHLCREVGQSWFSNQEARNIVSNETFISSEKTHPVDPEQILIRAQDPFSILSAVDLILRG